MSGVVWCGVVWVRWRCISTGHPLYFECTMMPPSLLDDRAAGWLVGRTHSPSGSREGHTACTGGNGVCGDAWGELVWSRMVRIGGGSPALGRTYLPMKATATAGRSARRKSWRRRAMAAGRDWVTGDLSTGGNRGGVGELEAAGVVNGVGNRPARGSCPACCMRRGRAGHRLGPRALTRTKTTRERFH